MKDTSWLRYEQLVHATNHSAIQQRLLQEEGKQTIIMSVRGGGRRKGGEWMREECDRIVPISR